MSVVFAPASATASAMVSKTGTPSTSWPPLPGVTPATRFVPYALLRRPWKRPSLPVRPWTTSRVSLSTMIATSASRPSARASAASSRPSWTRSPSSSRDARALLVRRLGRGRARRLEVECRAPSNASSRDLEAGELEEAVPLVDAVVADVARVAQPVGLLGRLADERVVADHDAVVATRAISFTAASDVGEVVRGDAAGDGVEARVRERELLGAARSRRPACPARGRR